MQTRCQAIALAAALLAGAPGALAAQEEGLGLGASLGWSTGFAPYVRDRVALLPQGGGQATPLLYDEVLSRGTHAALELRSERLEFRLFAQWHARSRWLVHHSGASQIPLRRALPSGEIEDEDVVYEPVEEREIGSLFPDPGRLFIGGLGVLYHLPITASVSAPVGGGLIATHAGEERQPWRLGARLEGALRWRFRLGPATRARLGLGAYALATRVYGDYEIAARRATARGARGLGGLLSWTIGALLDAGIIYYFR